MTADEIARILDELGQRLGPAGSYVFELAVRQKLIEGLLGLVLVAALVAIAVVVSLVARWRIALNNAKHPDESDDYHVGFGYKVLAHAVIWSLALCVLAAISVGVLTNLLNPEYAALRDLLDAIR